MRTPFTAVSGLIYATGFIFLWGWLAVQACNRSSGTRAGSKKSDPL